MWFEFRSLIWWCPLLVMNIGWSASHVLKTKTATAPVRNATEWFDFQWMCKNRYFSTTVFFIDLLHQMWCLYASMYNNWANGEAYPMWTFYSSGPSTFVFNAYWTKECAMLDASFLERSTSAGAPFYITAFSDYSFQCNKTPFPCKSHSSSNMSCY